MRGEAATMLNMANSEMTKLSELLSQLKKGSPSRYVREFRTAIIDGRVRAVELADRFKIPATKKGGKPREVTEYAAMNTPELRAWHEATLSRLARGNTNAPTWEDVQAGRVTFEDLEQRTRERLEAARVKAKRTKQMKGEAATG